MANVNSISGNSSNSYSSLYNSSNTITGLASGMDTEAMIENAVSGYQTKITQLQQSQTSIEWKQDAYRELIDQMYSISQKYTSYTSKTNLASNAFFTSNVTTTANGSNASAITASGKAKSDIRINAVTQLASAARYAVDSKALNFSDAVNLKGAAISGSGSKSVSTIKGSLTLTLGTTKYTLDFAEDEVYADAQALTDAINEKLEEQKVSVKATLSEGKIAFSSTATNGDSVYLSGASGNFKSVLGVQYASSSAATNRFDFTSINVGSKTLSTEKSMVEYLSDKTVEVTLNGVTKKISVGTLEEDSEKSLAEQIAANLQSNLNKAFGAGAVTVSNDNGALQFGVKENTGSSLRVTSDTEELGIGTGLSSYFNSSAALGTLLGDDYFKVKGEGAITQNDDGKYYDSTGARTDKDGYLLDSDGNTVYEEKELIINGESLGTFGKDRAFETVMTAINNNADVGVNVNFSALTGQFVFTARDTGSGGKIEFGGGLAQRLFQTSSDPSTKTIESVFGSSIQWDEETGEATIELTGPATDTVLLGTFKKTDTMETLMAKINSAAGGFYSGMLQYDSASDSYVLRNRAGQPLPESAASQIKLGAAGQSATLDLNELAASASTPAGASFTEGRDAIVSATVNGQTLQLTRSTNVVEMDGLTVTLKEEFDARQYDEDGKLLTNSDGSAKVNSSAAVTFTTSSNADAIVEAVRSFVEDINKLMTDVHSAYTTQRVAKTSSSSSKGTTYYEPLTDDDKADMSESAIQKYEEKAKTGLLFGDTDLSQLYNKLLTTIQSYGTDRIDMEAIGLSTTYSSGVTTLSLNEEKLRAALDSDPDKVQSVFTKSKEYGATSDGLMTTLKSTLNAYASTSITSPGILVRKAGTKLSSLSLTNNNLQSQLDILSEQIESWQTKLSNRVDYYTKQFTQLEKLMSSMNNQSSMLSQMMGY